MRYIIYGAGGIGGVLGGRLFAAGHDVVLICRGAHLDAIRERGLTLREPEQERRLAVRAVGHPSELRFAEGDVVILTMKSHDTATALDDLEAAGGAELPVVCCQNGVANERLVARRFARVYGMLVATPATFLEPGVVQGWATPVPGVLDAGCFPSGVDDLIERVAADITSAGFVCRADPAIMRLKYAKLLQNLANALQVVIGASSREETGWELMEPLRDEALACYAAAGIDCADAKEYDSKVSARRLVDQNFAGERHSGGSTWQSLVRGHQHLETDYLNGEIVLLGKLYGVPTPYNAALRRLAQRVAADGGRPGACSLEEVERLARELVPASA